MGMLSGSAIRFQAGSKARHQLLGGGCHGKASRKCPLDSVRLGGLRGGGGHQFTDEAGGRGTGG